MSREYALMSGAVTPTSLLPPTFTPSSRSDSTISRSESGNGSGRNSTASTIENIAVVAPMPNASIRYRRDREPRRLGQLPQHDAKIKTQFLHSGTLH